jgi:hypothetical protein
MSNPMKNCEMKVESDILTITVDLLKESFSGKSIIIGPTEGNFTLPGRKEIKVRGNAYKKLETAG